MIEKRRHIRKEGDVWPPIFPIKMSSILIVVTGDMAWKLRIYIQKYVFLERLESRVMVDKRLVIFRTQRK